MRLDIAQVLLLKPKYEYCAPLEPEENNRSRTARLSFAGAGNALLYDSATKIGVNCARIRKTGSLPQFNFTNASFAGETCERLRQVDGQSISNR